ncbi:MAG: hypothetical protein ACK55I_26805, partial [bacterium]
MTAEHGGTGLCHATATHGRERVETTGNQFVDMLFGVVMRDRHEQQGLHVVDESAVAAVAILQGAEQRRGAVEIFVRITLVPGARNHQSEYGQEVVIEENGERAPSPLDRHAVEREAIEHQHRRDLGCESVGDIVPALEHMQSCAAGAGVEAVHDAL